MRLTSLALLHLAGSALAAPWLGRSSWILVVGAAACVVLRAGAVMVKLV